MFRPNCDLCGKIFQYADDTTYHFASKQRERNQQKLTNNLLKLADFLTANQLVINMDKTHLEEIMIKQKRGRLPDRPPELEVTNSKDELEVLKVSGHCRILGLNVQNNLTWNFHLENGKKPLLPSIRRSLGALKSIGKQVPFNCRNTLARGFVQSRLTYLISIWGGATPNLIRKVQIIQNMAARWGDWKKQNHQGLHPAGTDWVVLSQRNDQTQYSNYALENNQQENPKESS